jgi:hypothetical protein
VVGEGEGDDGGVGMNPPPPKRRRVVRQQDGSDDGEDSDDDGNGVEQEQEQRSDSSFKWWGRDDRFVTARWSPSTLQHTLPSPPSSSMVLRAMPPLIAALVVRFGGSGGGDDSSHIPAPASTFLSIMTSPTYAIVTETGADADPDVDSDADADDDGEQQRRQKQQQNTVVVSHGGPIPQPSGGLCWLSHSLPRHPQPHAHPRLTTAKSTKTKMFDMIDTSSKSTATQIELSPHILATGLGNKVQLWAVGLRTSFEGDGGDGVVGVPTRLQAMTWRIPSSAPSSSYNSGAPIITAMDYYPSERLLCVGDSLGNLHLLHVQVSWWCSSSSQSLVQQTSSVKSTRRICVTISHLNTDWSSLSSRPRSPITSVSFQPFQHQLSHNPQSSRYIWLATTTNSNVSIWSLDPCHVVVSPPDNEERSRSPLQHHVTARIELSGVCPIGALQWLAPSSSNYENDNGSSGDGEMVIEESQERSTRTITMTVGSLLTASGPPASQLCVQWDVRVTFTSTRTSATSLSGSWAESVFSVDMIPHADVESGQPGTSGGSGSGDQLIPNELKSSVKTSSADGETVKTTYAPGHILGGVVSANQLSVSLLYRRDAQTNGKMFMMKTATSLLAQLPRFTSISNPNTAAITITKNNDNYRYLMKAALNLLATQSLRPLSSYSPIWYDDLVPYINNCSPEEVFKLLDCVEQELTRIESSSNDDGDDDDRSSNNNNNNNNNGDGNGWERKCKPRSASLRRHQVMFGLATLVASSLPDKHRDLLLPMLKHKQQEVLVLYWLYVARRALIYADADVDHRHADTTATASRSAARAPPSSTWPHNRPHELASLLSTFHALQSHASFYDSDTRKSRIVEQFAQLLLRQSSLSFSVTTHLCPLCDADLRHPIDWGSLQALCSRNHRVHFCSRTLVVLGRDSDSGGGGSGSGSGGDGGGDDSGLRRSWCRICRVDSNDLSPRGSNNNFQWLRENEPHEICNLCGAALALSSAL